MKVPLGWLRDYVDLNLPVAHLVDRLTLAGLEVAAVRVFGLTPPEGVVVKAEDAGPVWDRDRVVVGKVLGVERHPNADRLTLVTVDYGGTEPRTVVTGAPNLQVGDRGQKVIVALSGAVLFDGHADGKVLKELKASKIRGVASDAMVCSAFELGISEEHEGIILLEDNAPVGVPLAEFMGDIVLEVDVTPNLARCLSMIGVAREVAALTGQVVRLPPVKVVAEGPPVDGKVRIDIADAKLSARYAATLIQGLTTAPAPGWMQRRLAYAGMRPISNVVDVTNFVMLEWGQPLHAFDYDRLVERAGGKVPAITVRLAHPGESLVTLDGVHRKLKADNLVIADAVGPVAIAGVMGGKDSEVTAATGNILLESANFDFVSVRRAMQALNLPSEASLRFSKGIHPETAAPAARRAAELMRQHAGGTVCRGLVDCYPAPLAPQVIALDMREVRRLLGIDLPTDEATRILRSLEFGVQAAGDRRLLVTTPAHRLDVQAGAADLIEELARIHGYDRLPATLLAESLSEQHHETAQFVLERLRDGMVTLGLQEVITYALTEPGKEAPLGLAGAAYVELMNPISSERRVMRHSVLAGVLEVAAANFRYRETVRLFEIGAVYLSRPGQQLPDEPRRLAIVISGSRHARHWADGTDQQRSPLDFFDIKGIVEALASELHLKDVHCVSAQRAYLHPGQGAQLVLGGKPAGDFGQLHPEAAAGYGLSERTILVAELDVEAIVAAVPDAVGFSLVTRFPAALRDIAVIVPTGISAERVEAEIRGGGGALLRDVRLFDLYRGPSIPPDTKSLAYALTYQAADRTLTDKEVDKAHKKIEDRLRHVLQAQVRGQEQR
jgi:phenylalanyl-tRNA synthetase beta chain